MTILADMRQLIDNLFSEFDKVKEQNGYTDLEMLSWVEIYFGSEMADEYFDWITESTN